MVWTESGGPPVSEPERSGFGSRLLGRAFAAGGGEAKVRFPPDGVVCEMTFATLEASPGPLVAGETTETAPEAGSSGP